MRVKRANRRMGANPATWERDRAHAWPSSSARYPFTHSPRADRSQTMQFAGPKMQSMREKKKIGAMVALQQTRTRKTKKERGLPTNHRGIAKSQWTKPGKYRCFSASLRSSPSLHRAGERVPADLSGLRRAGMESASMSSRLLDGASLGRGRGRGPLPLPSLGGNGTGAASLGCELHWMGTLKTA